MNRKLLAKQLVSASSLRERRRLLIEHSKLADSRLAVAIKDICYKRWTSEPIIAKNAAAALSALAKFRPNDEINAVAFWIDGIAKISASKFQQAIDRLDAAANIFRATDGRVDAAQTQVAKLIALAMLGRYEEADEAGRSALGVFQTKRDHLAAGKIEMNLSNIAARREMHGDAERYALSALRRFKKIGQKTWQTMAENDLANTYSETNEFRKAEKYFAMADESAKAAKMKLTQAEIEASMGNLEMFRGRYAEALRYQEMSRQKYDDLGLPHQSAIAQLEIAEIYAELNLVNEAIPMLQPLIVRLKSLRSRADEARARMIYARLLVKTGEPKQAASEIRNARKIYSAENNSIGVGRTDLLLAEVLLRTRDFSDAWAAADRDSDLFNSAGNKRLRITADWLLAEIFRLRQQGAKARTLLNSVINDAKKAEIPVVTIAALTSLGKLESTARSSRAAKSAFTRAVFMIERMRSPIASDEFKMSFLASQLEPYNELFRMAVDAGNIKEAFALHELARARSLVDAVEYGATARSSGKITKKLLDIREELNWFYSRIARVDAHDASKLETEISSRERQITDLTRQIDSLETARSAGAGQFDLSTLQAQLKNDNAIIEYVELEDSLAAFVVTSTTIVLVRSLGNVAEIKHLLAGLRFQFGSLRFGAAAVQNFLPHLKRNADEYLSKLYDALISPLAKSIVDKRLVIMPTGVLNYVPFNALFDGDKYLIERHEVSISPSARLWMSLSRSRRTSARQKLLIAFSDESIPLAEKEVKLLKRTFKSDAISLTGQNATFGAFVQNAPKANLIHLACHGQFRSDNPTFSSLHLADGWVTVRDIARQKLRASLVTLSACETGLSEIHKGEELLGLTRGFLSAGAKNLIVSLWTVNDASTTRLMSQLYTALQRGNSPTASLRTAQMEFIASGIHPYYWSPFIAIGK